MCNLQPRYMVFKSHHHLQLTKVEKKKQNVPIVTIYKGIFLVAIYTCLACS